MRQKARFQASRTVTAGRERVPTIIPYARDKARSHEDCATQPYGEQHTAGRQVSGDPHTDLIEARQLSRPRDGGCPEAVDDPAERQDEVEQGRDPNPVLPGGTAVPH